MSDRVGKEAIVREMAKKMNSSEDTAAEWLEATLETFYETFKQGKSVTLKGFGGFYVSPRGETWAFKFNPGQKLRALFGWSTNYKGKL